MSDPSFSDFLRSMASHPQSTLRRVQQGHAQTQIVDEANRIRHLAEARNREMREGQAGHEAIRSFFGDPQETSQPVDREAEVRRARAHAEANARTYGQHRENHEQLSAADAQAAMNRIRARRAPDQGVTQSGEFLDHDRVRREARELTARGDYQDLDAAADSVPDDPGLRDFVHHQSAVEREKANAHTTPEYQRELGGAINAARDREALDYENMDPEMQSLSRVRIQDRNRRFDELNTRREGSHEYREDFRHKLDAFLAGDRTHQATRNVHSAYYAPDATTRMSQPDVQDERGARPGEDSRRRALRGIGEGRYSVGL